MPAMAGGARSLAATGKKISQLPVGWALPTTMVPPAGGRGGGGYPQAARRGDGDRGPGGGEGAVL